MVSASPLVKNDPRIPALIERLAKGANLTKLSADMGYSHHVQFRNALKEEIGREAYVALMVARAKRFNRSDSAQQ
jgi:hypothetical protein